MNQFISFPKSGRTWVRYCLLQYGLTDKDIHFHHDGFEYSSHKYPELDFDHMQRISQYQDTPTIFMKRNFLDTYMSFYHQIVFRFHDIFQLKLSLDELSAHLYFGYSNLLSFHQMQSQVVKALNKVKVIDYQDCQNDMYGTMQEILKFYSVAVEPSRLSQAVNRSTFEEMRRVEEQNSFGEIWLQVRNHSYKTRRGAVDSFYKETNLQTRHYFNDSLLRHDIVKNHLFLCHLTGQRSMEKNVLANDIDFIFKKYGKKLKVVDNHTLRREGNISKDSAKIHAVSALVKTYINKGYNVVLDLNMTQEETCLLRKEFPSHFLAVCLHGEEISRAIHLGHKNGVEADIKINILELNAEQVLSKVLSEIYYGLLYR